MRTPEPRDQIEFLSRVQRLLGEGDFTASYKFALLLALADIAVERGDDSGGPLVVPLDWIAEKFIRYYWRQAVPYQPGGTILLQNTHRQAKVIQLLSEAHASVAGSLSTLMHDVKAWARLRREVARVVRDMPLLKLQRMGEKTVEFLYRNQITNQSIELLPGVAFCLRRFYGLVEDLLRGAWLRFVRGVRANRSLLGESSDLDEFLFGSERSDLSRFMPILVDFQEGCCFYCSRDLSSDGGHIDHFIPWSRYPVDLGHNMVMTHEGCNLRKGDALACIEHLERWWRRNDEHGATLAARFDEVGLLHDREASFRVARWAYEIAEAAHAQVWIGGRDYTPLDAGWRAIAT